MTLVNPLQMALCSLELSSGLGHMWVCQYLRPSIDSNGWPCAILPECFFVALWKGLVAASLAAQCRYKLHKNSEEPTCLHIFQKHFQMQRDRRGRMFLRSKFLDDFLLNRIGCQVLLGHFLACRAGQKILVSEAHLFGR